MQCNARQRVVNSNLAIANHLNLSYIRVEMHGKYTENDAGATVSLTLSVFFNKLHHYKSFIAVVTLNTIGSV